jgi:hypothetical protein
VENTWLELHIKPHYDFSILDQYATPETENGKISYLRQRRGRRSDDESGGSEES